MKKTRRFADAAFLLGELYRTGSFTEKNNEKALAFIQVAADQRHPGALFRLAMFYYRGECGLIENFDRAYSCFNDAAELGHFAAYLWKHHLKSKGQGTLLDTPGAMTALVLGSALIYRRDLEVGSLLDETETLYKDLLQ